MLRTRSAYTFAETSFWLGEWSFFRAPLWLLMLAALYAVVFRRRRGAGATFRIASFVSHHRLATMFELPNSKLLFASGLALIVIANAAWFTAAQGIDFR